jgi:hypothetical protein
MAAVAAGATCGAVNSRPLQGKEQQPAVSQDCRLLLYRGERGLSLSHEILYLVTALLKRPAFSRGKKRVGT